MNYSQFARLMKVSHSTISNWEKKPERLNLKEEHYTTLQTISDLNKEQAWERLELNIID